MPGSIVRLQVQVEPLKRGQKPARWYDASRIRPVDRLHVDADGAVGQVAGEKLLDAHHTSHPHSRHHGPASGLSLGFTAHYRAMRASFGEHVRDGVAGENILVESDEVVTRDQLEHAVLRTRDGREVSFLVVQVAEPCVEFSRCVLNLPPGEATSVREPLRQLRGGMRGFLVAVAAPVELQLGDELLLP